MANFLFFQKSEKNFKIFYGNFLINVFISLNWFKL